MSADNLHRFLIEVQKEENATLEDAHAIMNNLHDLKILNIFHRRSLHLDAFFKYLFADINPPLNSKLGVRYCCSICFDLLIVVHN